MCIAPSVATISMGVRWTPWYLSWGSMYQPGAGDTDPDPLKLDSSDSLSTILDTVDCRSTAESRWSRVLSRRHVGLSYESGRVGPTPSYCTLSYRLGQPLGHSDNCTFRR
jgi:hypothetical protein